MAANLDVERLARCHSEIARDLRRHAANAAVGAASATGGDNVDACYPARHFEGLLGAGEEERLRRRLRWRDSPEQRAKPREGNAPTEIAATQTQYFWRV